MSFNKVAISYLIHRPPLLTAPVTVPIYGTSLWGAYKIQFSDDTVRNIAVEVRQLKKDPTCGCEVCIMLRPWLWHRWVRCLVWRQMTQQKPVCISQADCIIQSAHPLRKEWRNQQGRWDQNLTHLNRPWSCQLAFSLWTEAENNTF